MKRNEEREKETEAKESYERRLWLRLSLFNGYVFIAGFEQNVVSSHRYRIMQVSCWHLLLPDPASIQEISL